MGWWQGGLILTGTRYDQVSQLVQLQVPGDTILKTENKKRAESHLNSSEPSSPRWAPENTSLTWSSGLFTIFDYNNNDYNSDWNNVMILTIIIIVIWCWSNLFRVLDRDSSGTIGFMELMLTIELVGAVKYDHYYHYLYRWGGQVWKHYCHYHPRWVCWAFKQDSSSLSSEDLWTVDLI